MPVTHGAANVVLVPVAVLAVLAVLATAGCEAPLDVGTDIIWNSDFETGDWAAEWRKPPGSGGLYGGTSADASVVVTTGCAHGGKYGAKLSSIATFPLPGATAINGVGLYKEAVLPKAAYYSAWYRIPEFRETLSQWNILKLKIPITGPDGGAADANPTDSTSGADGLTWELLSLSLESLPPGQRLALVLTDGRRDYLTSPFPGTVPLVPIDQWFQIECYYDNDPSSGELRVWLDGVQVYDVYRPMSENPVVWFMPCSIVDDLDPPYADLCLDDVAISYTRVSPGGVVHAASGE